jgi:hypothetical protein
MPVWKVLLTAVFFIACMRLATAAVIVPFAYDGNQRWMWLGGFVLAVLFVGALFALFLRHAGRSLEGPARR